MILLEIIIALFLMVVVAIVGKKPDGTYKEWSKIVFWILGGWLLVNFVSCAVTMHQFDQAMSELGESLGDFN